MAKKYYAVKKGHKNGIFTNWNDCREQVSGLSGAMYKSFDTKAEAEDYLNSSEARVSERYETEEEVLANVGDGEMIAYVDGSNLGDGSAFSWGIVTFTKQAGKAEISGMSQEERFIKYRNISGELFASVKAVNNAIDNGMKKISIYHDYSGIRHYALEEWAYNNDLSIFYRDFFKSAMKKIEVEFVKVDGHTEDVFNEEADILAKKAIGII